jgi:hypothetical protein
MSGTPHLTPDQLGTLAEKRASEIPAKEMLLEHLAQCQSCRETLFLLIGPARKRVRFQQPWLAAAAIAALAVLSPILLTRQPSGSWQPARSVASAHRHLPEPFRRVSLAPAALRKPLPAPHADQFVVQTTAGERWISFRTLVLFRE